MKLGERTERPGRGRREEAKKTRQAPTLSEILSVARVSVWVRVWVDHTPVRTGSGTALLLKHSGK